MNARLALVTMMVLVAALTRVLPHPPNLTAVMAMSLFGAATIQPKWLALIIPVAALFVGDLLLEGLLPTGLLTGWIASGSGFHSGWWVVYGATFLVSSLGFLLRDKMTVSRIAGVTLFGSVMFFMITNFAVWAAHGGLGYSMTLLGLIECYVAAIPFFQYSLLGDLFYSTVLFGAFILAERRFPVLARPIPAM